MYIAILQTDYEIYAIGETEAEVKRRVVKGYKELYPDLAKSEFKRLTFRELEKYVGVNIYQVDMKRGWVHQGE